MTAATGASHPDDEFHPPTSEDPYWTETCWFTFAVPERRLSGQLYPFFRPNQKVCAGAAYVWDESGYMPWTVRYGKNFWHLPLPDQPLSALSLPNGMRYRCLEPLHRYELSYEDPDGDDLHIRLTYASLAPPNYLGQSHLDQPGRYTGEIILDGERMAVDSFGFRDRSWGVRSQFGPGFGSGGYTYATVGAGHGFHTITMDTGSGYSSIHGYLMRDGKWAKLRSATRAVVRSGETGFPYQVAVEGEDEDGRGFSAHGRCLNHIALHLNPNLFTVNSLTEWELDGVHCYGEDHDNWSAAGARRFFRSYPLNAAP
ncbi:MAG TPA: hypothetical protein VGR90_00095 [Acidimicrobiales bacterium]|nr:hypothetical protein [Acidimicrobiales bacterium]